jgi:ribosomal protein L21E
MTDHKFEVGNHVRIDIPDETNPDYSWFHGRHGEIVSILEDDAIAVA